MRLSAAALTLILLAAPTSAQDWRAPCVTPDFGLQPDAGMQAQALSAAFACMQTRIEELEQENAAMRARLGAAEDMARAAMDLARATPDTEAATN